MSETATTADADGGLDAPDCVDWETGELLDVWIGCGCDVEEFARRVKVAHDSCGSQTITYTGVDPDGEHRECPACMQEVDIDPVEGEVTHVDENPESGSPSAGPSADT
ncbi:hypothetical protein [Halostella litorea]|uniref:hypothetical protein n=1 Tax=Halostella litorea TaxID=2528831 RepID=UPI001091DD82|nr:hypothetical protein [Halostella litorea]